MTTEEKIEQLQPSYYPGCDFNFNDGYSEGLKDAAKVAKEADFLMREMVEFLETTVSDSPSDRMWKEMILDKYRNWETS